ncbi:MAG: nucleotide exchange factor GrpE [Aureispira sp.]
MEKKEFPVEDPQNDQVTNQETEEPTAEEQPVEVVDLTAAVEDLNAEEQSEETNQVEEEETVEEPQVIEEDTTNKLSDKERLEKELGEMKDKYLRIFAEFDNYRKRTIKERQDIIKLAARDALSALLPAVNDFDRAIKVAQSEESEEKLPEGIVLVYNKLFKALEQQGIKQMVTDGEEFDPELHEALTKIPAPTEELKGKIIDTIEKGYYLNDKIIHHAKVVVGQ